MIARFQADSASYQAELINTLEEEGVEWTIIVDKNSAVMSPIDRIGGLFLERQEKWPRLQRSCMRCRAQTARSA